MLAEQEQTVALFPPWAMNVPSDATLKGEIAEEACTNTPIKSLQTFKYWLQPPLIFQQAPLASSLDSELVSRIMIATGPRRGGRGGRARRWTGQHVLVLQHAQVLCQIGQGLASGFGARNAPFDV